MAIIINEIMSIEQMKKQSSLSGARNTLLFEFCNNSIILIPIQNQIKNYPYISTIIMIAIAINISIRMAKQKQHTSPVSRLLR